MPRPAMYSPDVSQHSPRLYRLSKYYGVPMTVLADRLICFGLQRLEEVMPGQPAPEPVLAVAEEQTPYRAVPRVKKAA
jgi:hypothetical protein